MTGPVNKTTISDAQAVRMTRDNTACLVDAGYSAGYRDAIDHAVDVIEHIAKERGWTSARTVGVIGTLAARVRRLSP